MIILLGLVWLQNPLPYAELHYKVSRYLEDLRSMRWLNELRPAMEAVRRLTWNNRFFNEVAHLYLKTPESPPALLEKVALLTGINRSRIEQVFPQCPDSTDPLAFLYFYAALERAFESDTSATGYVGRQLVLLARSCVETWLAVPHRPPLTPLIRSALKGYLRGLIAGYEFFGFAESSESWKEKITTIEKIGLLEYFAYGETANTFRAWRKGTMR
ncbi:MAG: hypothetical protein NZ958_02445 [Bacteroidia bacterium]|nr:hypothetical protein [Bacteroidia bacterium]MDW8089203.1 hypothetical protein [Bacteroidia bacterium]